jgi:hypothetical protein
MIALIMSLNCFSLEMIYQTNEDEDENTVKQTKILSWTLDMIVLIIVVSHNVFLEDGSNTTR